MKRFCFTILLGLSLCNADAQKAYRLTEVPAATVEYNRNKAFSLNEEVEDESYKSEASITVGAAIPCVPFALYVTGDDAQSEVTQGAKTGVSVHANYIAWFIKYFGFGVDFSGGFMGYDFSKISSGGHWQGGSATLVKTTKMGWNMFAFGVSLRTKIPLYKNDVFLTGRISMQYGMLTSPLVKEVYRVESGTDSEGNPTYRNSTTTVFPQFTAHKFLLGGGVGVRVRVRKRMYALANFDYNYAISNNFKNKSAADARTKLFSNYAAFSVEAGISYVF
ncbi:MAG: hypothetical protein LBQ31_04180 [Bacteroidales bacterium]|jgi:hypothetical protein|nr:hypothetical protein [Bacteroidales bacterium]